MSARWDLQYCEFDDQEVRCPAASPCLASTLLVGLGGKRAVPRVLSVLHLGFLQLRNRNSQAILHCSVPFLMRLFLLPPPPKHTLNVQVTLSNAASLPGLAEGQTPQLGQKLCLTTAQSCAVQTDEHGWSEGPCGHVPMVSHHLSEGANLHQLAPHIGPCGANIHHVSQKLTHLPFPCSS